MNEYRPGKFQLLPLVIKNLMIINGLVWLVQITLLKKYDYDLSRLFALHYWGSELFKPHQFITHLFLHDPKNITHVLFNMFTLWMFGRILENVWGSRRFFIFYMICGLGAAGLHLASEYFLHGSSMAVGASGAVFGVLVAFAMTFPNTELYIMFIPIPIKAKWAITGLIALDLFFGIYQASGDGIAHYAHLGGAITGFLLLKIWNKTNRKTLY